MSAKCIKIVVAEDSRVIVEIFREMLADADDIEIIAVVDNGVDAVKAAKKLKPDLITMDINMPQLDGLQAIKKIMVECPTPIIVISGNTEIDGLDTTFEALNAGAVSFIRKPTDLQGEYYDSLKKEMVGSIRALSEIHVIRQTQGQVDLLGKDLSNLITKGIQAKIIGLGVSTGGPQALAAILSDLSDDFSVPIVVVQHITDNFLPGMVSWLQSVCKLSISIATNNEPLLPGHIYFAPDSVHLTIVYNKINPIACFEDSPKVHLFKPSVTSLFASLAKSYPGESVGGLLTGMGSDGSDGLLLMKEKKCFTFIQDEQSSIVFGMPKAGLDLNAQCATVNLNDIAKLLNSFSKAGEK